MFISELQLFAYLISNKQIYGLWNLLGSTN